MKNSIITLNLIIALTILSSCAQFKYSHLSKVRVKQEKGSKRETAAKTTPDNIENVDLATLPFTENEEMSLIDKEKKKVNSFKFYLHANSISESAIKVKPKEKSGIKKFIEKKEITEFKSGSKSNNELGVDAFALIGFISGILGLFILPALFGVIAIVFSAIGLSRIKNGKSKGKGFAVAGLVLGIICVALTLLFVISLM